MATTNIRYQYYLLTGLLDSVKWQIKGGCEDIDCDKYIYLDCMKKSKRVTVLKHKFSCIPKLKRDYKAIIELLDDKKFRKLRYKKCPVCHRLLDSLSDYNPLKSFISKTPKGTGKFKGYEMRIYQTHKRCKKKLKVPEGFRYF